MRSFVLLLSALVLLAACGQEKPVTTPAPSAPAPAADQPAPSGGTATDQPAAAPARGEPGFRAQPGWQEEKPGSGMRKAQFRLPKVEGDAEDAEVVVFFFGGDGGGVEANLERWEGQFTNPDGSPAKGELSDFLVKGRRVDLIELHGNWAGSMGQGAGPGKAFVGAVIESEGGLYFARLVGPEKTVAKWRSSYLDFLKAAY